MKFSERIGVVRVEKVIQSNDMNDDLRIGVWNIMQIYIFDRFENVHDYGRVKYSNHERLIYNLWFFYFKLPVDEIHSKYSDVVKFIKNHVFKSKWYEVYDLMEFFVDAFEYDEKARLIDAFNKCLSTENSAYRFVSERLVEITSKQEISEIENALNITTGFEGAKIHLLAALNLLSDRHNPDYRNSIKESITAVESMAKTITESQNGTLADALKKMEKHNGFHPALIKAFSNLYGYTSNANGIRHALLDKPEGLEKSDATFMLVCCSAFINYSISKGYANQ